MSTPLSPEQFGEYVPDAGKYAVADHYPTLKQSHPSTPPRLNKFRAARVVGEWAGKGEKPGAWRHWPINEGGQVYRRWTRELAEPDDYGFPERN